MRFVCFVCCVLLVETDEMLNMGFADSVETILKQVPRTEERPVQTLLFSATVPEWGKSKAQHCTAQHSAAQHSASDEMR